MGARWIEVCKVSTFELSKESKYDSELYIVVKGVAKEGRKAKKKFRKKLEEAIENKDTAVVNKLFGATDEDLLEMVPEFVIVKPVLFRSYGITPKYIVELVKQQRK